MADGPRHVAVASRRHDPGRQREGANDRNVAHYRPGHACQVCPREREAVFCQRFFSPRIFNPRPTTAFASGNPKADEMAK